MKKTFLQKAKRRVTDSLRKFIKKNYYFKPSGIYYTSKDFVNSTRFKGSEYVEIYPELTTSLSVPDELYQALSSFANYDSPSHGKDSTLTVKNNYAVLSIPHGRLYTNNIDTVAIITPDNRLVADMSFQYNISRLTQPHENKIFELAWFDKPTYYKGTLFNMLSGGGAVHNYGHWLLDSYSRLHLLKESGWFDKVDWFLVPNYVFDYQKDSLALLGIDASKVIVGENHLHLQTDHLITCSHPRGMRSILVPDWMPVFYRNTILPLINNQKEYPRNIYISRRDSNLRNVTNEDEVMNELRPLGFESFELSKLSFQEKIALFANAEVIVSASGAGLNNLFFAPKGAKLMEIFSESFVHPIYYNIAHSIGLDYEFLICRSPKKADNMKQGLTDNITVDVQELKKRLNRLMYKAKAVA